MRIAGAAALVLFALLAVDLHSTTYYVDSRNGNDNSAGTGTGSQAWQTVTKVNSMAFGGDSLLFVCGGVWNGALNIKGTGTAAKRFVVSKYGTGAMPVINGGGASAAITMASQNYFILSNLEVTNIAPGGPSTIARQGILVSGQGTDITVRDMYIHNVDGSISGPQWYFQNSAAIRFQRSGTGWNNVLIDNNRMETIHGQGIYVVGSGGSRGNSKLVRIRNNFMKTIGGDGIDIHGCDTAITEHNTLSGAGWQINGCCAGMWSLGYGRGCIFQFNEVYGFLDNDCDGEAWDEDNNESGQIVQYSYSHNCNGGFFLYMNTATVPTLRYNISQNDGASPLLSLFCLYNGDDQLKVYNNVFYNSRLGTPVQLCYNGQPNSSFFNNILVNIQTSVTGQNNCYFGARVTGQAANGNIIADPMLVAPGTGDTGLASTGGYKLAANSPCIGKGKRIAGMGVRDFFGNTLPSTGPIDIGAHQYSNQVAAVSDLSAPGMPLPAIVERGACGARIRLLDRAITDARVISPSGKVVAILSAKGTTGYTVEKVTGASVVYLVDVRMGKERRTFPLVVY